MIETSWSMTFLAVGVTWAFAYMIKWSMWPPQYVIRAMNRDFRKNK